MKKLGKYFLITLTAILFLLVVIILSLRLPAVQQKITDYATNYVSDKTDTRVDIDKLYITFLGAAKIEGIYLEDQQKDTLLFANSLTVDLAWKPLLDGFFRVKKVDLHKATAHIYNQREDSTYNFQFLVDAFSSGQKQSNTSDTTNSTVPFSIQKIDLSEIHFKYNDVFTEMNLDLRLQKLYSHVDSLNFNDLYFGVEELSLNGVDFKYVQEKTSSPSTDTSSSTLPVIQLHKLALENIKVEYKTPYDSLFLNTNLKKANVENTYVHLNDQNIKSDKLLVDLSSLKLLMPALANNSTDSTSTQKGNNFEWPEWEIALMQFQLNLDSLSYDVGNPQIAQAGQFNASHLHYHNIMLGAKDVQFKPVLINLSEFEAKIESDDGAFHINKLTSDIRLTDKAVSLKKLDLITNNSTIKGTFELGYPQITDLVNAKLEKFTTDVSIKAGTSVNLKEAYYFSPSLKEIPIYDSLSRNKVQLSGTLSGRFENLIFNQLNATYSKSSSLHASGKVEHLLQTDSMAVRLSTFKVKTDVSDFSFIIPELYSPNYPQQVRLNGSAYYSAKKVTANVEGLLDGQSEISLKANYYLINQNKYKVDFKGKKLALGKWLGDTTNLSSINLDLEAKGSGIEWPELSTQLDMVVTDFSYANQAFDSLKLELDIKDRILDLKSSYEDDKLKYQLTADGKLDNNNQDVNIELNIDQINLKAFEVTDSLAYLKTNLIAKVNLDSISQKLDLKIDQLSFADRSKYFELAPLNLTVLNGEDSSRLDFSWEAIELKLKLNQPLNSLANIDISQESLKNLNLFKIDTTYGSIDLQLNLDASLSNDLKAIFNEQINFKPLHLNAHYESKAKELGVELSVPELSYNGLMVDSLQLDIEADSANLKLVNSIAKIESGFINIFETKIESKINAKEADFSFKMRDAAGDSLFILDAVADNKSDSLQWKIDTETLILNGEKWSIDDRNYLYIGDQHFVARYMAFQRSKEKFLLETVEQDTLHGLHINFQDFEVANLISLLNPEEIILSGILNGDLKLPNLQNPLNFKTNIELKDIELLEEPAGTLKLSTQQLADGEYELEVISTGPLEMNGSGKLSALAEVPSFDIHVNLKKLSLPFITVLSGGAIKEAEGIIKGEFDINGDLENLNYSGNLNFSGAKLFITELNTSFTLDDEIIKLQDQTINLSDFTIVDKQNRPLSLNGSIQTKNLFNPSFDLKISADNFQLMNKEDKDNPLYYGTAFISADASVKGNLKEPKIRADITIKENTNFVYVVPTSAVDVVQMEGIVRFKSPYEALDSLQNKSDSTNNNIDISGIEIDALIKTDKKAQFKVVVDKRRGDYLVISGESDLNFELDKNGDVNLTGNYLANEGYYQLSLYDLVKRKFEITSGSQVKWYGDPMEASLDITANYKLEASPQSLMVGQSVSNKKLPFIVELFINGSLSLPEISFGLTMPQDARGALGGRAFQQVQAISNNETELNKQVFSLLVLNQFFPAGSTGEGPDSEVIARNSASQILTNQLNKLSGQYIKGVDLNLDLDSYKANENGAEQQRTQLGLSLSKSLFNDRFTVQVGSQFELESEDKSKQTASDILGNVLIEYLLTEDGRYKLTGYRKNEYEGLIDGQVTVTGISVQFNKEFEKFSDLLDGKEKEDDEK